MSSLLVVDDEPGIRTIVTKWAEASGFDVSEASCAAEALDRMAASPASVALCDVNLPDRNGLWLAAQMRRQFPHTALVMTTGFGIAALPSSLHADSIGFLTKPFTQEQLLRALDWALQWQAEQSQARVRRAR
jgi:DNA-binding NtrC family response regulator